MIRLLRWLLLGHVHQWVTESKHNLVGANGDGRGIRYALRCTKCGDVKKRDLI